MNVFQWLRYGPWLAQVVVTRRCNLKCGYCTEYDRTSDPVPYDELALRLAKLAELRAWAVCLTGGEPTMHPRLPDLVAEMRRLGFKRRMMITNGWRLTPALIDALNGAGLTDMQISVDGVNPNRVTAKTLQPLRKKLELLAERATFKVVMSGVIGSAPAEEALEVVDFAKAHGFTPRILLVHDENGQSRLSHEELAVYDEAKRRIGDRANEAFGYRGKMIEFGRSALQVPLGLPLSLRGRVRERALVLSDAGELSRRTSSPTPTRTFESSSTRRRDCNTHCTIGCARTASATDEWRSQRGPADASLAATVS